MLSKIDTKSENSLNEELIQKLEKAIQDRSIKTILQNSKEEFALFMEYLHSKNTEEIYLIIKQMTLSPISVEILNHLNPEKIVDIITKFDALVIANYLHKITEEKSQICCDIIEQNKSEIFCNIIEFYQNKDPHVLIKCIPQLNYTLGKILFDVVVKNQDQIYKFDHSTQISEVSNIAQYKITNSKVHYLDLDAVSMVDKIEELENGISYLFCKLKDHKFAVRVKKTESSNTEVIFLDSIPKISLRILDDLCTRRVDYQIFNNYRQIQKQHGCATFTYKIIRYLNKKEFNDELDQLIETLKSSDECEFDMEHLSFTKIIANLIITPPELQNIENLTLQDLNTYNLIQNVLMLEENIKSLNQYFQQNPLPEKMPQDIRQIIAQAIELKYLSRKPSSTTEYKDTKGTIVSIQNKRPDLSKINNNIFEKNKKLFIRSLFLMIYKKELSRSVSFDQKNLIVDDIFKKSNHVGALFLKEGLFLLETIQQDSLTSAYPIEFQEKLKKYIDTIETLRLKKDQRGVKRKFESAHV
jgi:hypothetical protein